MERMRVNKSVDLFPRTLENDAQFQMSRGRLWYSLLHKHNVFLACFNAWAICDATVPTFFFCFFTTSIPNSNSGDSSNNNNNKYKKETLSLFFSERQKESRERKYKDSESEWEGEERKREKG